MSNPIVMLPYLNIVTPCKPILNGVARPAAALLEGPPGIGKSAIIEALSARLGATFRVVILSTHEAQDLGGYPWPNTDRVHFLPPDFLMEAYEAAARGERVVVLLDDFTWAHASTQAAAMRLVLEGRIGNLALDRDRVRFVLVMNPASMASGSYDVLEPMKNRCTHYKVGDPGVAGFLDWLNEASDGTEALPAFDEEAWESGWVKSRATISAFLRARPQALHENPGKADGRGLMSYATRRSFTSLALLDATVKAFDLSADFGMDVAAGSVGEPTALEFREYERVLDLGDPEAYLKDPASVPVDKHRDDRLFAILTAIAHAATTPQKKTESGKRVAGERWDSGFECLRAAKGKGADRALLVVAARSLWMKRPAGREVPPKVQAQIMDLAPMVRLVGEV